MTKKIQVNFAEVRSKFDVAQDRIGIIYDKSWIPHVMAMVNEAHVKHGSQLHIRLELPTRKMTTGPRSQNGRIHGHCADIAAQLVHPNGEPIYTADQVKAAMKRMSVEAGYPTFMNLDGQEEPLSLSQATVEQAKYVIDTIQRFADENGLYLTEYDENGERYLSIGGKSRDEMEDEV